MLGYSIHQLQGEKVCSGERVSPFSADTVHNVPLATGSRMLSESSELHRTLQETQALRQLL